MKTLRLYAYAILWLLVALGPSAALAAISAATVWEVRTAGSDSNGGGFVAGGSGTDYSQQASAQYTFTDLASSNGNTNPCVVSSSSHSFVSADVGNIMQITAGTNWTTGFYQVVSVATGAATLDRACGSSASLTGGTYAVGGALASLSKLCSGMIGSNKAFIKNDGTYSITSGVTCTPGSVTPSATVPWTFLQGYTSTRGDGGRATIQLASGASTHLLTFSSNGIKVWNLVVDANNISGTTDGIIGNNQYFEVYNVKVKNYGDKGILANGQNSIVSYNEVTGAASGASVGINITSTGSLAYDNYIHDTTGGIGIIIASQTQAIGNIVANTAGASADGIQTNGGTVIGNTVYNAGRNGIFNNTTSVNTAFVKDNILVNNAGCGLKLATATGIAADQFWDGNAYYNNTGGARCFADDTSTNAINGVSPYTNTLDITLTGSPFNNAGSGDFTLNNTSGAGAAIRQHGLPSAWPGLSITGYPDMGAVQHPNPTLATPF